MDATAKMAQSPAGNGMGMPATRTPRPGGTDAAGSNNEVCTDNFSEKREENTMMENTMKNTMAQMTAEQQLFACGKVMLQKFAGIEAGRSLTAEETAQKADVSTALFNAVAACAARNITDAFAGRNAEQEDYRAAMVSLAEVFGDQLAAYDPETEIPASYFGPYFKQAAEAYAGTLDKADAGLTDAQQLFLCGKATLQKLSEAEKVRALTAEEASQKEEAGLILFHAVSYQAAESIAKEDPRATLDPEKCHTAMGMMEEAFFKGLPAYDPAKEEPSIYFGGVFQQAAKAYAGKAARQAAE